MKIILYLQFPTKPAAYNRFVSTAADLAHASTLILAMLPQTLI